MKPRPKWTIVTSNGLLEKSSAFTVEIGNISFSMTRVSASYWPTQWRCPPSHLLGSEIQWYWLAYKSLSLLRKSWGVQYQHPSIFTSVLDQKFFKKKFSSIVTFHSPSRWPQITETIPLGISRQSSSAKQMHQRGERRTPITTIRYPHQILTSKP